MRSQAELDAIVEELRAAHWALGAPLRYNGMRQLLRDQEITVEAMPLPVRAMTVLQFGLAAISINSDLLPREQTPVLAEEYAHAKLHAGEPGELTIHLFPMTADDPREYEADYVARCLLAGPGVAVEYRVPERSSAPAAPPRRIVRRPMVVPNPYEATPVAPARHRKQPRYGGRLGERALDEAIRRSKSRRLPRPLSSGPVSDDGQILYERGGVVRYVDADGRRWRVHDVAYFTGPDGVRRREVIEPGRPVARIRYFVNAAGAKRMYHFGKWELRDVAPRHFARQLRDGTLLPVRAPSTDEAVRRHGT